MKRFVINALIAVAVAGLQLSGALEVFEMRLMDLRFATFDRPPTGDVVVVGIDDRSIRRLGVWPWPRALHGMVVNRLHAAGAAEIVIDVDFSSASLPAQDAAFADALARAGGTVTLPVFSQHGGLLDASGVPSTVDTGPRPEFLDHVDLASANVFPHADGLVRQIGATAVWDDRVVPTLAAVLAGSAVDRQPNVHSDFYIDYGIDPGGVVLLPFFDVLVGDFAPDEVRGKRVIIAATAVELADYAPVPLFRSIPGGMVQVLAAESLIQDRTLGRSSTGLVIAGTFAVVFGFGVLIGNGSWRRGLIALVLIALTVVAIGFTSYVVAPILVDMVPWLLAAMASYVFFLIQKIDLLDLQLLARSIALRRKNAFLRRVAEHAFDGLITTSPDGVIRWISASAERIFGTRADRMIGCHLSDMCLPPQSGDDRTLSRNGHAASLAGFPAVGQPPQEMLGRRANGEVFPVEVAITEISDHQGPVTVVVVRDISERTKARRQADRAQARLLDAVESSPDGFVLFDAADAMVLCNRRFRELLAPVDDTLTPGARFLDIVRAMVDRGYHPQTDIGPEAWMYDRLARYRHPSGRFEEKMPGDRWLAYSERRTIEGGVVGIVTDITEAKERERDLSRAMVEAELASRAKSEFLANVSHEMRTPLNAIIGFAELMEQELMGPIGEDCYKEYAGDIRSGADRLLRAITDVLDLSRIQVGDLQIDDVELDVVDLVEKSLRLISARTEAAGLTIGHDIAKYGPRLTGDERLIRQALMNILSNAVKFTPRGGAVTVSFQLGEDQAWGLSVTDTGIGIEESKLGLVLEPFGQADSGLSRRFEGTGLGLTLSRSFVELHGGTLTIRSAPGEGTTVILLFPAERILPPARGKMVEHRGVVAADV